MWQTLLLIVQTILGFIYCLRLGYIWTNYPHGGQFAGIPFALVMVVLTAIHMVKMRQSRKRVVFIIANAYCLTFAGFSITVELIRATMDDYFDFLYQGTTTWIEMILIGWLLLGAAVAFIAIRFSRDGSAD